MRTLTMSDFARRYKLLDRIAVGGTAEVFHDVFFADDGSERKVVIKRVLPQFARDERFRRLFHEEACVAVTVTHPNIVRVLDHGELEQTCYIALEPVEGLDLGNLLTRARGTALLPPANLAAFVVTQVAEALQFIHDQTSSEGTPLKIIHRDVSPQNILVSFSGDVKLTDFGIAKSAIRHETTVDGTLRGKLDYMAPEQATLKEVDQRADLFALGCVLYEMLQGSPPFHDANEILTLDRVREGRIVVPLEQLDAPPELKQVLDRVLQVDREQRYQHAAEMVADLRRFMAPLDSAAALREALARWARQVSEARAAANPADAVESAVRRLMGDTIEDRATHRQGTTVFASSSNNSSETLSVTGEVRAPASRVRRRHLLLVLLTALAISGWLLWAVFYFGRDSGTPGHDASPDASPDTSSGQPDARTSPLPDAARPASPPTRRTLSLQSQPASATVMMQGRVVGRTPMELTVPDRRFVLELSKPNHRAWSRSLDPASMPATIRVVLRPAATRRDTGSITINSMPWCRVTIDGSYVGNTPLMRLQLPAGKHQVELRGPDGAPRKRMAVSLRPGQNLSYSFDFTR